MQPPLGSVRAAAFAFFVCTLGLGFTGAAGATPDGALQGSVWFDADGNGLWDADESPLMNWPVQLQDGRSTLTGLDGAYAFIGLGPGTYTVRQSLFSGWRQSFPQPSLSPAERFAWARTLGGLGEGSVIVRAVAPDPLGGLYMVGEFTGTVDLDPGPAQALAVATGTALFVMHVHADGAYDWSRTADLGYGGGAAGVAADAAGVSFVGTFTRSVLSLGAVSAGNPGLHSLFLACLRRDGTVRWVRSVGGDQAMARGRCVTLDGTGALYVAGQFRGSIDLDPGPGTQVASSQADELCLLKLSADAGDLVWARVSQGLGLADAVRVLASPTGDALALVGNYRMHFDLNWGGQRAHLQSSGDVDTFALGLSREGTLQWVREIKGSYSVSAYDAALDPQGNLYVVGMYTGDVDTNPGLAIETHAYYPVSLGQCYLWKLDPNGTYVWTRTLGSLGEGTAGTGVATDSAGRVYVLGESTPLGADPNAFPLSDLFLARYDGEGTRQSLRRIERVDATVLTGAIEYSFRPCLRRLAAGAEGELALSGPFSQCVDLDPGSGLGLLCPPAGGGSFVSLFEPEHREDGWRVPLSSGQTVGGLDFANTLAVTPQK